MFETFALSEVFECYSLFLETTVDAFLLQQLLNICYGKLQMFNLFQMIFAQVNSALLLIMSLLFWKRNYLYIGITCVLKIIFVEEFIVKICKNPIKFLIEIKCTVSTAVKTGNKETLHTACEIHGKIDIKEK